MQVWVSSLPNVDFDLDPVDDVTSTRQLFSPFMYVSCPFMVYHHDVETNRLYFKWSAEDRHCWKLFKDNVICYLELMYDIRIPNINMCYQYIKPLAFESQVSMKRISPTFVIDYIDIDDTNTLYIHLHCSNFGIEFKNV